MDSYVMTNAGAIAYIEGAMGDSSFPTQVCHVAVNNFVQGVSNVPSDFVECTVPGYGDATLGAFAGPPVASGGEAVAGWNVPFLHLAPYTPQQTMYGLYFTSLDGLTVYGSLLFGVPYPIPTGGLGTTLYSVFVTLQAAP
jgi:hypothetical protein